MISKLQELKLRFREKLEADPTFSITYREKIVLILDAAIEDVFNKFRGDRG